MTVEAAHAKSTETASVVFSVDGRSVITRGGDDTVKRRYGSLNNPLPLETRYFSVGYSFLQKTSGNAFRDDDALPWHECSAES